MKISEIREKTIEELNDEVVSQRKKLFDLRLAKSMHKLENTSEISKIRTLIAQLKTVINEKSEQK